MNFIKTANIDFYQNLGKIFYAIAAADKHVRDEELKTFEDIINNEWILEKNGEGNIKDNTVIIIDTFRWLLNDNEYNAEYCYNSFINFKRSHEVLFNKNMKSQILRTASKIAASFSGKNKSELLMLAKLNIEFKKDSF